MNCPAEIQSALKALERPLRIGDLAQLEARRVLTRWKPQPCKHCSEGYIGHAQCRLCDGGEAMTFGSLFSGVGGIELGLERAGWTCAFQVEIDPFCRKVLEKHWPGVKRYGDITQLRGADLPHVDLLAGGFPCQDLSQAGKRAGIEASRSGLWFEFARLVREIRPRYVLAENVPGLLVRGALDRVIGELAGSGYVGCWRCLRASEFGASHLRKRVFIVAYSGQAVACRVGGLFDGERTPPRHDADGRDPVVADANGERCGEARELRSSSFALSRCECDDMAHAERTRWAQAGIGRDFDAGSKPEARCRVVDDSAGARCGGRRPEAGAAAGNPARLREPGGRRDALEFAPGPADPRWPAILAERPDLAPALAYGKRERGERRGDARSVECAEAAQHREALQRQRNGNAADGGGSGLEAGQDAAPSQSAFRGVADGLPDWMDGAMTHRTKRLSRLGNAVVPAVAEWVGRRLLEFAREQE